VIHKRVLAGVVVYLLVVALLAAVFVQSLTINRTSQQQHECIVELALMLADPERDRSKAPNVPAECRHQEHG
jgi:hypothetical protein